MGGSSNDATRYVTIYNAGAEYGPNAGEVI